MSKFTSIVASVLALVIGLLTIQSAAHASPYTAAVLADSPVAAYHMDETSGTTMLDAVSSNNGSYGSGVTLNSTGPQAPTFPGMGASNPAPSFNGTSTSKAVVSSVSGLSTTAYSMEVWFNYSSNYNQYLIGRGSGASLQYDAVGLNGTQLYFFNGVAATFSGFLVSQNAWHDLVMTRDATALKLYVDGVIKMNLTSGTGFTPTFSGSRIVVGDRPADLGGLNPVGLFDEVSLYSTALTQAQVTAHYQAAFAVPEPSSVVALGAGAIGWLASSRRRARKVA